MANRYFVGAGSWDNSDTTVWSDTSGGTTGFSVPTSTDDVFFDANSGNCAISASVECDDLDFTGYVGTLSGASSLGIYGSLTLAAGMTRTYIGSITFRATSTGKTITFAGKTTSGFATFNGVGGGWTINDTWNNGSGAITLTAGTLNTNGQTVTSGAFSISGSTTRTLTLGASTINCRSWGASTTTNLTFNVGTSTINCTSVSANSVIFAGGGLTYNVVTFTATANGLLQISGVNTFGALTFTGGAVVSQVFDITANQTITGTLTIAGNSLSNRLCLQGTLPGTAITISAATTTLSNCDFIDITGTGAGSWSGTSLGNGLGNTGITFTTPVTRYAVAAGLWSSTAVWSATSGGSSGATMPLCHDTVLLNGSSGSGTITIDVARPAGSLTCTGYTGTIGTAAGLTYAIFGDFVMGAGMTMGGTGGPSMAFCGRGSHVFNPQGLTITSGFQVIAPGGTYTQQANLIQNASGGLNFQLISGTYDANNFNVTIYDFTSALTVDLVRRLDMGSGTWTLFDTGTVWNTGTSNNSNLTINSETSTIDISNATTSSKTFAGGGKTYNVIRLSGAGIATYTFSGSNTIAELASTKTVAHTIRFTAGTTQTIGSWSVSGTAGNLVTINSNTTGTHTLTKTGGGRIISDYLNIQHSIASPSDTWYAGLNSTDNQAVATAGSGWLFTIPLPTVTTQAVSAITDVTALGNGNITDDGSGTVTERGFVYDLATKSAPGNVSPASSGYASVATDTGTFTEGAFTKSITGLTPLTTYYVRAYCLNEAGYDYGDEVSFATGETPEVAIVTTQDPTSVTATTATGNGTIVDANGTVTRRGFAVSTTTHSDPSNTDPDVSDYELVFSASGSFTEGTYTTSLTGLTIDTLYYIRAFTENGEGFSYGSELSFMTDRKPAVTVQAPTNRQSTTITLTGTVTDAGGDTIDSRGFVWDTATQPAPGDVAPASSGYDFTQGETGTLTVGVFDEAITGLDPNTTYYVRAYAQNTQGYTYTDEISFSTITFPNTTIIINEDTNTISVTNTETASTSGIINQSTNTASIINQDI